MPIFCAKCGVKNTSEDKFCKDCGAKLAGSAETPKEEVKSEQPSAPKSTPVTPARPDTKVDVPGIVRIIFGGILFYLAWLILGQFLNSSNTNVTPGGNKKGYDNPYCISYRCPASAPYDCDGQYYDANGIQRSFHGCLPVSASEAGYSSWTGTCVKPICN